MTEDDTFRKLKREPDFDKVKAAVRKASMSAAQKAATLVIVPVLKQHGWTEAEYHHEQQQRMLIEIAIDTEILEAASKAVEDFLNDQN